MNIRTLAAIACLLLAACSTPKPVTQYYIGFRKSSKAQMVVAIPQTADTTKWVILQTVNLKPID